MSKKDYSKFNPGQQRAVLTKADKDILIAAGAGSGKTKVLSERVFRLMDDKEIKPSELLVLTFTKNAAHEMKSRIVSLFKKEGSSLSDEMLSAHIQTFDSFSQYLVSTYSSRLGIASTITIADETMIEAKKREILDQVMNEWYSDPVKHVRLVDTAKRYNVRGDEEVKKIVFDLDRQFSKMMESNRQRFIDTYDDVYYSEKKFDEMLGEYLADFKDQMKIALYQAAFIKNNYALLEDPIENREEINSLFDKDNKKFFETGYASFDFASEHQRMGAIAKVIKDLIAMEGVNFIKEAKRQMENKDLVKAPSASGWGVSKDEAPRLKMMFDPLRLVFATQKSILYPLSGVSADKDALLGRFKSTKDDVHVFFDLTVEMENRLFEYEKSINSFTFSDISTLALRLVLNEEYKDIAEEIRQRFKYIMVDEYQDTNDFQEAFINSLLKPNEKGERAHVFCVGDAKQSIYGFRESNVELFRARQRQYEIGGSDGEVIAMNTNYRTGKQLLLEINEIFKKYMSEDHGSIDYTKDMEQLKYDDGVNLYGLPYDNFHVYRIHGGATSSIEGEIKAIIHDIKEKVASGYPVYEKGKKDGVRPCRYGDFAILTRAKKFYADYQAAFNEAGIPLNLKIDANLREIDSVIVTESLLRFYLYVDKGVGDPLHLFASIARSYIYSYDDDTVYRVISDKTLASMKNDPIYTKMEEFHTRKKDESLSLLFLSLIEEFGVLSKLHLVGSLSDATAKIESLYIFVTQKEAAGEDLESFLGLFSSISKYDLKFNASSDFEVENSVDLMTIHASKGLERKVVYLPNTQNHMSRGNNMTKPSYGFSTETGLVFPRYFPDMDENGNLVPTAVKDMRYKVYDLKSSDKEEINEHVRLFYVSLTRAENAIYIVGEPTSSKEDLYDMLNTMPHALRFNDAYIQKLIAKGVDISSFYRAYLDLCKFKAEKKADFSRSDFSNKLQWEVYDSLYKKHHVDPLDKQIATIYELITTFIYRNYVESLLDFEPDTLSWLYASYCGFPFAQEVTSVDSFSDLYDQMEMDNYSSAIEEIDEAVSNGEMSFEEGEKEKALYEKPVAVNRAEVREAISLFALSFKAQDVVTFTGHALTKTALNEHGEEHAKDIMLAPRFLVHFAKHEERESWVSKTSFASPSYPDLEYEFRDDEEKASKADNAAPSVDEPTGARLDDSKIEFEPREKRRASKKYLYDIDNAVRSKFDFGERLHRYMELYDFKKKDLSFIKDEHEKSLISRAVNSDLLKSLEGYDFKKEYGYYDEELKTTGFIDLLATKDGQYVIVDYKTKNIKDEAYASQLHAYQRNVMRLFGVDKTKIRLYLLSIIGTDDKEIPVE